MGKRVTLVALLVVLSTCAVYFALVEKRKANQAESMMVKYRAQAEHLAKKYENEKVKADELKNAARSQEVEMKRLQLQLARLSDQ